MKKRVSANQTIETHVRVPNDLPVNTQRQLTVAAAELPWKVEMVPLECLRPADRNCRTHSDTEVLEIANSISRFGIISPIVADDRGKIVAGHARAAAAKRLGLKRVPVIRLSHLNETELRAFALADNRLAEKAGWDPNALALELGELQLALPEISLDISATGFQVTEVDLILDDRDEAQDESAEIEAKSRKAKSRRVVSRRGDVWLLGAHRLACGEAGEASGYAAVDAAIRSWQCFTRTDAIHQGTRQTFDEILAARKGDSSLLTPQHK